METKISALLYPENPGNWFRSLSVQYHVDDDEDWTYTFDMSQLGVALPEVEDKTEDKTEEKTEDTEEEKEKTVISMTATGMAVGMGMWEQAVMAFNKENKQYYIELDIINADETMADRRMRLMADVGTGKGPDIMTVDAFPVSQEMLDKGILLDLAPYMQASGITDENFFNGYINMRSGEKIYGLSPEMGVSGMTIDQKVLGGKEIPDLETLTDKLLAYPEKAGFLYPNETGDRIMDYFLGGSENLWGMIDWENRRCDFSGELFSKILDVSKRYQQDGKSGCKPIMKLLWIDVGFSPERKMVEDNGRAMINYYFDDGCFPLLRSNTQTLFINASTEHPDGAWAFLSYMMTKKGQNFAMTPVRRDVCDEAVRYYLKMYEEGRIQMEPQENSVVDFYVFTKEGAEEMVALFDEAKRKPVKTEAVLEIIYEESGSYFSGDKSKEQVIDVIQNRVQLYLNEN